MKRFLPILITLFCLNISYSQVSSILNSENIRQLNRLIDSIEQNAQNRILPELYSLPQTTAHHFEISTKNPKEFLKLLATSKSFEEFVNSDPNLQIDRDLLVIKNIYANSKGEKQMEIKSFEIGNNSRRYIKLDYTDSLNKKNIKYFFTSYTRKNITNIRGFYLNDEFESYSIPTKYSSWVSYTDMIVQPEGKLFYNTNASPSYTFSRDTSIVNSLLKYYAKVTDKPAFDKNDEFEARIAKNRNWENMRTFYSDSLFKNDPVFKELLFEALDFAEKENKSNGELEFFTAQLISKSRALELIRNNQQVGTCSFDNGPRDQQKRMASLAADIPNWGVFIESFMNLLNDNVSRVADNNIASNARRTYIEELELLDLDLQKLLLGSNLRISDTLKSHYFSNGSKVGKAFAQLDGKQQASFENELTGLIKDENIDAFNKLHFYNTYKNYQYFLQDSLKKIAVEKRIVGLVDFMPYSLRSRIIDSNKQLKDLLYLEKGKLENYEILDSSIGSIYSYSYDGDCWMAEIKENNSEGQIIYDLTMPMEEKITPFQNFLDQKSELTKRVKNHKFLQQLLKTQPSNKLYLKFTRDRSFANHRERITNDMPKDLVEELDFKGAISLYISYSERKYVRYILLKNKNLVMLDIPKEFSIPGYTFEELVTKKEESFLHTSYQTYRVFNEQGEMLR
jgi:hypothetical protein